MKTIPIIIFFLIALIILGLAHTFVFASWARFFSLSQLTRRVLGGGFIVLTLGFIGSAWLSHYVDNSFSRLLYQSTSVWVGLFSNLFIGTIIAWPIYLLLNRYASQQSVIAVFAFFAVGVLALTVYGVVNAKNIYYRSETVKMDGLPQSLKGMKAAQISDIHLNNIHNEKYLESVVERLNKENISVVFLTGDFFDGMDGQLDKLVEPLSRLKTDKGIYFISGNHEMYMGLDKAVAALEKQGVICLLDQKKSIDGLEIVGLTFPDRDGLRRDLAKELNTLDVKKPSIFLFHDPRDVERVAETDRVSLMLSGHTHNGQLWPYNFIVRQIYGIYSIGRHQVGNMVQFTTTGAGTWGPPMRSTGRPEVVIFTLE